MNHVTDVFLWTQKWAEERGLKIWAANEIDSTNTQAKNDMADEFRPLLGQKLVSGPSLYLARHQTSGRGRGTHTWTTPEGSSLLSSWSFAVARVPQPIFSALVGLALFESCVATWPDLKFNVKAPNDLFIGHQKTAGILIETIDQGTEKRTVIGLGLNATHAPAALSTATSVASHLGRPPAQEEWQNFLDRWCENLTRSVEAGLSSQLLPEARERLRHALNLHPLLHEPILKVDEFGQLHSASRVIHWHEL